MPRKLTTEEFIIKAQKVHGKEYDYSLVKYQRATSSFYTKDDMVDSLERKLTSEGLTVEFPMAIPEGLFE